MVTSRAFFNAVAIPFISLVCNVIISWGISASIWPAVSSAAELSSRFVSIDAMPRPDLETCARLGRVAAEQDARRCADYRAPTSKQASENITECFSTESYRATGLQNQRRSSNWYRFCVEKTLGRDVTAVQIRKCFQDALEFNGDIQGRLMFSTCIDGFSSLSDESYP